MRVPRAVLAPTLIALLAILLAACPAPQAASPTPDDDTPEETVEATVEATVEETEEETAEPTEEETEEPETAEPTEGGDGDGDGDYVRLEHDEAEMVVEVPTSWTDTDTNDLWAVNDEVVGYSITASPDIESFLALDYEVPGVYFAASEVAYDQYTPDELLDQYDLAECEYDGRDDYSDPAYTGRQDFYVNCGDTGAEFAFLAATADDGTHIVLVQVSALDEDDLDAYEQILNTFLAGDLPELPAE